MRFSQETLFLMMRASTQALALLVAGLIVALLLMKAGRILSRRREAYWTAVLAPLLEEHLSGPTRRLEPLASQARRAPEAARYLLVRRSFGAEGETHARLAEAYEKLGFMDGDLRRLRSPFWWVRAEAARCLGQMRCRPAKGRLLEALRDGVLEVRLLGSWALGRIGDADVVEPIITALVGYSRLAGMRLSSTVFELGEKAVEPLLAVCGHPDAAVRLLVVHLLGELRDPRSFETVLGMAKPPQPVGVRIAAVKALGGFADPRAEATLAACADDGVWELRAQAAKSLGRVGASGAIPVLCRGLEDRQWWVRRNSGEALAALGAPGRAALRRAQKGSADRFARDMAAQWLDELENS
ncbi:MAG: HEAT repeat domain-containing protein [Elusimicrobia bacterium]|nr:HEAT repeat domain-containing protein [Elusimicrobiota bacterium]